MSDRATHRLTASCEKPSAVTQALRRRKGCASRGSPKMDAMPSRPSRILGVLGAEKNTSQPDRCLDGMAIPPAGTGRDLGIHNVKEPGVHVGCRMEHNMNMADGEFKPKTRLYTNVSHFRPLSHWNVWNPHSTKSGPFCYFIGISSGVPSNHLGTGT